MDNYQIVKENAIGRSELTKRQDDDVLLRNLDAYVMKDKDKKEYSGVIHVTLNRPKVMANYIIAALSKTSEQILVETEDKNLDTDYIKDFRRLAFAAANLKLLRQGDDEINPYFDEQSCIRGGAAARCLFRMKNDVLIPDITPWDDRYVNYETGNDGQAWASYGYGTKKKKAAIQSEKWVEKATDAGKKAVESIYKQAEVVDIWTPDLNEIWLDGVRVFEQENYYGFVPVVVMGVPLGSMLADENDIANHNESVFFLIRSVMPELNRLISIIQTHNVLTIKRPIQTGFKDGASHEAPDYNITDPGASSSADPGGGTKPIDLGAITNAAVIALNMIDKALDDAGFSLEIFNSPLASGIAIIQAKEGKDVIYLPRLRLKSLMKQCLGDMFTAQVIQIGGEVEIGTPGHKRKFNTKKLEGQYEVTHQFSVKSLTTDAGLASLAAAYGNLIPDRAKRREIIGREDPDGDERWLSWEEAGRLSPLVKLRRITKDLIELDEEAEAELITDEAGVQLDQLLEGNVEKPQVEESQEPRQVVSLFGGSQARQAKPQMPQPVEEGM